jgi:hypothetical protein
MQHADCGWKNRSGLYFSLVFGGFSVIRMDNHDSLLASTANDVDKSFAHSILTKSIQTSHHATQTTRGY